MAAPYKRVSGRRGTPGSVRHRLVELRPVGSDGSAAITASLYTGPARITHVKIDYQNQPVTTDLLIKAANGSTGGATLYTGADTATDVAIKTLGTPAAIDEGNAVTAVTDGVEGGWFVSDGLYFSVAQGDGQTSGDERILIDVWYEELSLLEVKLFPSGADGSATAARLVKTYGAGNILGLSVDYGAGVPGATADLVIKSDVLDDASGGETVFTATNTATDIGSVYSAVGLGIAGIDEGGAAVAATDAVSGGHPFRSNLYFSVAQADGYAADEDIAVRLYIRR